MTEHVGIDGPAVRCAFETWWCRGRSALAGGLDEHHVHPLSLGGAADGPQLVLCPLHHRRQHALLRAMVEAGGQAVRTVRYYAAIERSTATLAITAWLQAGQPAIDGWPCPAAATRTT